MFLIFYFVLGTPWKFCFEVCHRHFWNKNKFGKRDAFFARKSILLNCTRISLWVDIIITMVLHCTHILISCFRQPSLNLKHEILNSIFQVLIQLWIVSELDLKYQRHFIQVILKSIIPTRKANMLPLAICLQLASLIVLPTCLK